MTQSGVVVTYGTEVCSSEEKNNKFQWNFV